MVFGRALALTINALFAFGREARIAFPACGWPEAPDYGPQRRERKAG
jgi:hypothetical protein